MAKDRIESKYVTVAPGVELHILEKGEGKSDCSGCPCTSLIHRWDTKTSFTTHFFGKIQYVGIK